MIRCWAAALAIGVVLAPETVTAQRSRYAMVSVSTTQTYESNLFAVDSSHEPDADLIVRVGPVFEAGYVSLPLTLIARYGFDAARFLDHVAFSRSFARQDAEIEMQHRPTRRLVLDVKTSYLRTEMPYELNVESALRTGHARAERRSVASAAAYEWTPVTRLHLGYAFARDALENAVAGAVEEAHVAVEWHRAERGARRLDYRVRRVSFDGRRSGASHVVAAGWSRNLTRRTAVEFSAGPRLSDDSARPEIEAMLRRRFQKGEVSVGYASTQATAIGEIGAFDVQRVAVSVAYRPKRLVTLSAAPAAVANARGSARVSVYTVDVQAMGGTRRGLSFVVTGRVGVQHGTFAGGDETIPYRSLSLALRATLPRPPRAARPRTTL